MIRAHVIAPPHIKFAGQSPAPAQLFGSHRCVAAHAWPSGHIASAVHPSAHALAGEQAHATGAQMNTSPCALHSLSPWHVEGGSKQAPHPGGVPGGAHGATGFVQSLWSLH
jgi:hypothetical protein